MKTVCLMNFVRYIDPRTENSIEIQYNTTEKEIAICKEYGVENTFLLQYDAVIDSAYQKLFAREKDEKTEIGLWYEIVEPLCRDANVEWNSSRGWSWDWYVNPGMSLAYTNEERKRMADVAMNRFREVFGYYPKTVASWMIDSFTVSYLADNYDISAFAICRDQISTDAYTLLGGYFSQAYYPARKNLFCPAQTESEKVNVPMFRLLGPDPIHEYDCSKYLYDDENAKFLKSSEPIGNCFTMEPVWYLGQNKEIMDWFFRSYYENEDLGFSFCQIGQENSFGIMDFLPALRMQIELLLEKYPDVRFMKMSEAGNAFKAINHDTVPTSLVATDDWNLGDEAQCAYYDCKNYRADIFRFKNRVFIRSLYLFDENFEDHYLNTPCKSWDATFENLPIVDTLMGEDDLGIVLDNDGVPFTVTSPAKGVLLVKWNEKSVRFEENRIIFENCLPHAAFDKYTAKIEVEDDKLNLSYKGFDYSVSSEYGFGNDGHTVSINEKNGIAVLTLRK